jgi:hypothetical protein
VEESGKGTRLKHTKGKRSSELTGTKRKLVKPAGWYWI